MCINATLSARCLPAFYTSFIPGCRCCVSVTGLQATTTDSICSPMEGAMATSSKRPVELSSDSSPSKRRHVEKSGKTGQTGSVLHALALHSCPTVNVSLLQLRRQLLFGTKFVRRTKIVRK